LIETNKIYNNSNLKKSNEDNFFCEKPTNGSHQSLNEIPFKSLTSQTLRKKTS